jgi:fucose permease
MKSRIIGFWQIKEQRAVSTVFLTMALIFGAWITRLPELQQSLGIGDAQLGTALFFLPLGAVTLLPFYSRLINAISERNALLIGLILLMSSLVFSSVATHYSTFLFTLYGVGLGIGLTDVSMNAVAAEIEKQRSVQIMSACHGFFSLGGMIGAFVSVLAIRLQSSIFEEVLVLALVILTIVFVQYRALVSAVSREPSKGIVLPSRELLGLALLGICIMMTEGGITDWSTIYLERNFELKAQYAGFGFAGFSFAMALGRFFGDPLIERYQGTKLIRLGVAMGILGLLMVQMPLAILVILGFSFSGLGLSVVVPILFGKAAKAKGVSPAKGLAAVASAGYVGWLVGPVTIGYVSDWIGLGASFIYLTMLCVIALLLTIKIR